MRIFSGVLAALTLTGAAMAEPVDGKTAKKKLFKPKGTQVEMLAHSFLSDQDKSILVQVAEQQIYYAAIAVSPDDGVISNATLAAANYHSTGPAEVAAKAACNAAKTGSAACVIVALIRPSNWSQRDLQLSVDGTLAFRKEYRRGRGEKAMAVSPSTGKYAIAKGAGAGPAAVLACNERASASDCKVVIADK